MPHATDITTIIPVHREQFLRTQESRLITAAGQPGVKSDPAIAAQLAAHSFAEDLEEMHATYEEHFLKRGDLAFRAEQHTRLKQQAAQLKLLALETLHNLLLPKP